MLVILKNKNPKYQTKRLFNLFPLLGKVHFLAGVFYCLGARKGLLTIHAGQLQWVYAAHIAMWIAGFLRRRVQWNLLRVGGPSSQGRECGPASHYSVVLHICLCGLSSHREKLNRCTHLIMPFLLLNCYIVVAVVIYWRLWNRAQVGVIN